MRRERTAPPKKEWVRGGRLPGVILASASPRRRELLKRIVPRFRIVPSRVDEDRFRDADPAVFAARAAEAKARAVGRRHPRSLVIAADTLVSLGNEVFGKPGSRAEAVSMLGRLSGRTHTVVTAIALYHHRTGRILSGRETSRVTFHRLEPDDLEDNLDGNEYLDKAGAYAIQESGSRLVKRLEGGYDNVVGLPLGLLMRLIQRFFEQQAAPARMNKEMFENRLKRRRPLSGEGIRDRAGHEEVK